VVVNAALAAAPGSSSVGHGDQLLRRLEQVAQGRDESRVEPSGTTEDLMETCGKSQVMF